MNSILETKLGFDSRGCGENLKELLTIKDIASDNTNMISWNISKGRNVDDKDVEGNEIFRSTHWQEEMLKEVKLGIFKAPYCDFWHYQLNAVFRNKVQNDQTNSIYVGTKEGINLKKLKKQPNEWQLYLLKEWNKMFHHLADKHGWIKVELWW